MNGLEEADYSLTDMAMSRGATKPGDETLLVKFFPKPCEDPEETLKQGRPIYKEVDYIEIRVPGETAPRYLQPATSIDIARFPDHYRRYRARQDQAPVAGTPLAEWPGITRAQVEELRFVNVTTMEQLVSMSDTNSQRFMGINTLKAKAKAYLENASGQAATNALLQTQQALAEQQELNARLSARLDALENAGDGAGQPLTATTPKRRTRPTEPPAE